MNSCIIDLLSSPAYDFMGSYGFCCWWSGTARYTLGRSSGSDSPYLIPIKEIIQLHSFSCCMLFLYLPFPVAASAGGRERWMGRSLLLYCPLPLILYQIVVFISNSIVRANKYVAVCSSLVFFCVILPLPSPPPPPLLFLLLLLHSSLHCIITSHLPKCPFMAPLHLTTPSSLLPSFPFSLCPFLVDSNTSTLFSFLSTYQLHSVSHSVKLFLYNFATLSRPCIVPPTLRLPVSSTYHHFLLSTLYLISSYYLILSPPLSYPSCYTFRTS